jgi:hypothetical protein
MKCTCGGTIIWAVNDQVGPNFQVVDHTDEELGSDEHDVGVLEVVGECESCKRVIPATVVGDIVPQQEGDQ